MQQITTVTMTFVKATFVLGTLGHISNVSAVTGPIWIKKKRFISVKNRVKMISSISLTYE